MTAHLATVESPLLTPYGTLFSDDAETSDVLRWVFGDLAETHLPAVAVPAIDVRRHQQPWERWEVRVDDRLVEPATDRDGMVLAVLNQFDDVAASSSGLALSASAVAIGDGAVVLVGQDALSLAATAARVGFDLLGGAMARLTSYTSAGFTVHPYPRPVPASLLAPLGELLETPAELGGPLSQYSPLTALSGIGVAVRERPLTSIVLRRPTDGPAALQLLGAAELTHHICVTDARVDTARKFHATAAAARTVPTFALSGREPLRDLVGLLAEAGGAR